MAFTHAAASWGDIVYGRFIGTNVTSTSDNACISGVQPVSPRRMKDLALLGAPLI
jgi:hypothetical protein